MSATDFFTQLSPLSDRDRARLLLAVAFELTIAGRGSYLPNSLEVKIPRILRGINELEHKLLSQALHHLDQSERYPDEVFAKILFETAGQYECKAELEIAIDHVSRRK